MTRLRAADPAQQRNRITVLFLVLTIILGSAQVWACRYEMSPDSMSYLDIARELAAGHFSAIADIMSSDEPDLWTMSEQQRQVVYSAFQKTGAQWIISQQPACVANLPHTHWKRIGTTTYYLYPLAP